MSDVIKLLPDSVANQIAAGEVIQRPASVIKELVENSVDAGATKIQVIIKDAGRTLIQVVDNGCGMSPTDARLSFERHATSKIREAADLYELTTMGFRGEALASICAVAQVDLVTMRPEDTLGTKISISGSKFESQEPVAAVPGSNLSVKNLFFNLPARRRFLKKDSVENAGIMREFERLALVNPEIGFELISDGKLLHNLMKGPLKQRIGELFGKTVERQLIPVEVKTSVVTINGFVGLPENARKRNPLQFLFVNGRNMRHFNFHKAVLSCYEKLLAPDVQPNYFLNFTVDPSTIEVNIHPTKNEIKFENEQAIWQILTAAIRNALGKFNVAPAIDFDVEDGDEIPPFMPDKALAPPADTLGEYNPFETSPAPAGKIRKESMFNSTIRNWDRLYEGVAPREGESVKRASRINLDAAEDIDEITVPDMFGDTPAENRMGGTVFQVGGRYIATPVKSGLMLIDQHRAHLLVLYNKYLKLVTQDSSVNTQRVIFPEVAVLSPSQNIVLDSILDTVSSLGFDLSSNGDNSWNINGVPALMGKQNPVETLTKLIEDVSSMTESPVNDMLAQVALSMARASAIRRDKTLTNEEMDTLLSDLLALPEPGITPDGNKVISIITTGDIVKLFS